MELTSESAKEVKSEKLKICAKYESHIGNKPFSFFNKFRLYFYSRKKICPAEQDKHRYAAKNNEVCDEAEMDHTD